MIEQFNLKMQKYNLLETFQKRHFKNSFYNGLGKGFGKKNPKYIYTNHLKYYLLHFLFTNNISFNDLIVLAVEKKDIDLIFYSIYLMAQEIEETHPRELQDWFFKIYFSLKQINENPIKEITDFLKLDLIKKSQLTFFNEIINDFEIRKNAFEGSYLIERKPFFHFKMKDF